MIGVARKEFMFTINIPFECSSAPSASLPLQTISPFNSINNKQQQIFPFPIAKMYLGCNIFEEKEMRKKKHQIFFFNFFYCWDYSFIYSMFIIQEVRFCLCHSCSFSQLTNYTNYSRSAKILFQCECKCAYFGKLSK